MTDDLEQAARDLIALDGERTPGEWSILNKPERGLQLITFPLSAHDQPEEQWSLGAIWSGGEKALTPDAKFVIHIANHAPTIAQAYLDQCEEIERLQAGFAEATRLIVPGRRGQPGVPWDGWTRTEYEKYATGFSDYREKVIGIERKALGDSND